MNWQKVFYTQFSGYAEILNTYLQDNYIESKLGDYIKILGGYAFKSSEYTNQGIPVIRISDFQNEEIVLDNVKYYNEDKSLSRYELYPDDIIIAMTGGTIGKLAIVQNGLGKLYLNQRVGKFQVIDESVFDKEFIYWIARGVEEKVKNLAWGGAQPNVSSKQIENMPFYCPEKEIQKNIVRFFNDLKLNKLSENIYFNKECETKILNLHKTGIDADCLKSEIDKQQNLLTKLKQSILQEAIEGKLTSKWREENKEIEPASVLLEKILAEKEQLIKEKKIKKSKPLVEIGEDEIPFEIPNNWEWCRLGKTIDWFSDYHANGSYKILKENVSLLENKDYAIMLRTTNFHKKNRHNYLYINEHAYNFLSKTKLYEEDIIMNKIADPGKVFFVEDLGMPMSLAMNLFLLRFNKNYVIPKYAYYYLLISYEYIFSFAAGSSTLTITKDAVNALLFTLPPIEEQKEIVNKIEKLFAICDELEEQINNSKQNTQTLMQAVLKEAFEK